ncbi:MAG: haloacid dehalogenase type II [Marinobacterium sp.]|nr:haloacid dehalogenase type II [Marinobacterium sp.]
MTERTSAPQQPGLTLAFDVYGTLIDTQGVTVKLTQLFNGNTDKAQAFAQRWREKQLEYTFRRGLMQYYANFATCTRDALNYTDQQYQTTLSDNDKDALLAQYAVLPAFADVHQSLCELKAAGYRLYAFSNGNANAVKQLLQQAGLRELFLDVISVESLCSYKPNPAVYVHFMRSADSGKGTNTSTDTGTNTATDTATDAIASKCWLISSNPFDVIGARCAGMNAAWVQRSPEAIFDPWGVEPTTTVATLTELPAALADINQRGPS